MNHYRQSIALFGFVIPSVIAIAVIVGAFMVKGRVSRTFDEKLSHFQGFEQNKLQALGLEAEISMKREHIEAWEALVSEETASTVTSNLREIEEGLPSKEFQKTAQDHPPAKKGFAGASAQNSSQIALAFRATFRSMQKALLDLESRMPQLQLQEMRIEPSPQSSSLNFQVTYTAWEK
ncbi:hypothetical protein [Haloferula sp.]|uniref:hypothetical protein n=1 Tax=Haloferula sp. TaxID=2497595 RepID=UPI00329DE864